MGKQVFRRETQILPRLNITDKHSSSYQLDLVCTKYRTNEKKPLKQAKYPNKTTETNKTKSPLKQMKGTCIDNKHRDIKKKVGIFHILNGILAKTRNLIFKKRLPGHIMDLY